MQHVNFLENITRTQETKTISLQKLGVINMVFFILLTGISINLMWSTRESAKQLQSTQQEIQAAVASMQTWSRDHPDSFDEPSLQAAVNKLEATLAENGGNDFQTQDAFSRVLTLFSDNSVPGVWIRSIQIEKQGRDWFVTGSAFEASEVQLWVDKLNHLAPMKAHPLSTVHYVTTDLSGEWSHVKMQALPAALISGLHFSACSEKANCVVK